MDPLAKTALWTASMRAREHERADRLFDEPLAALLATEDGEKIMNSFEGVVQRGVEDPALAVRTRFLDERMRVFGEQGWSARVVAYGSAEADYGRWAASEIAPGVSGTRGRYIIDATLQAA